MSQSRAFTDTEIITIATVAAAALGGIVVGLGRGQDDDDSTDHRRAQIESGLGRAKEAGSSLAASVPDRSPDIDFRAVASSLVDSYKEAQAEGESFIHRAADRLGPMLSLDQVANYLPFDSSNIDRAKLEELAARGRDALKTNAQDLQSSDAVREKVDSSAIAQKIRSQVGRRRPDESGQAGDSLRSQISDEVSSIEEKVASTPDKVQSARAQTGKLMRRKVADPVASAASTTKDATLDSVAALAWLGLGATVVYFGLLSSERREQVKSVLCGAIEQGRLLMLDLQGYEPEM
ncbi:MAG: hypothetical protein R3A46_18900 [Thermomicrobiales bacterium]